MVYRSIDRSYCTIYWKNGKIYPKIGSFSPNFELAQNPDLKCVDIRIKSSIIFKSEEITEERVKYFEVICPWLRHKKLLLKYLFFFSQYDCNIGIFGKVICSCRINETYYILNLFICFYLNFVFVFLSIACDMCLEKYLL